MFQSIVNTIRIFESYSGNSMLLFFILSALLYLLLAEKREDIRWSLVYISLSVILIFFFPLFSFVVINYFLDSQVYYRIMWLVPGGAIVCYAMVRVIGELETRKRRIAVGWIFAFLIMLGGRLVYINQAVTVAENAYHLPQAVMDVADIMHVEGRTVKAAVPAEMLQFIRQYDASIKLAYGRDALVEGWCDNPLFDAMETTPVRSYLITDYGKQQGIEYLVIKSGTPVVGTKPIEDYEFTYLATARDYDIYIFDRAEFAEEKKLQYRQEMDDDDHLAYYTRTD